MAPALICHISTTPPTHLPTPPLPRPAPLLQATGVWGIVTAALSFYIGMAVMNMEVYGKVRVDVSCIYGSGALCRF